MSSLLKYNQEPAYTSTGIYPYSKDEPGNVQFQIHSLEQGIELPLWNTNAVKLSRFEIIWIKKGKGSLHVDRLIHNVSDGIIYCITPGHKRKVMLEANAEGYYISFTPEFIHLSAGYSGSAAWLEEDNFDTSFIHADVAMQDELEVIVRKMKMEFCNHFSRKTELLKGLLNIFMIYFSRKLKTDVPDTAQTRETALTRKFMSLVRKNFLTQKMVSDYAKHLCVTANYLNRTIKKGTGYTASHHIQQQVVIEAKRQALYSNISMKEIAYGLGFDNLAHFSKFFKNKSGMNFTDFKKAMLVHE